MGELRELNPDQIFIFFGANRLQGFADGEFVRVEQDANAFEKVKGTDGDVSRSRNKDKAATITVLLMSTSPSNAILSAIAKSDANGPNGAGVNPMTIDDANGDTIFKGQQAWIERLPDSNYDRSATAREWVFAVAELDQTIAGT